MWVFTSSNKAGEGCWLLMSHLIQSIQRLLDLLDMVHQELVTQAELLKAPGLDIDLVSISIKDTSDMLQKLVQGLLVLQQVRDSELAIKLGEA